MKSLKIFKKITFVMAAVIFAFFGVTSANASNKGVVFGVSPMNQSIVLEPGNTYHGSFKIVNPNTNQYSIEYNIERRSFYVDEDYSTVYDEVNSDIVNWTKLDSDLTGVIPPNSSADIMFTIDVPLGAPAGGQYEAFRVSARNVVDKEKSEEITGGAGIQEEILITHLVFAEITGDTVRQGEIAEANLQSFVLSGNIVGTSAIKNTGNIHSVATYKLQVFPLFSDEEIYTNEEEPQTKTILPNRTLYNETVWDNTPAIGIFNVVYTVEFEGVTTQVSKMVIKCPIWLLFIIIFAIAALIIWLVLRAKTRKHGSRRERDE